MRPTQLERDPVRAAMGPWARHLTTQHLVAELRALAGQAELPATAQVLIEAARRLEA